MNRTSFADTYAHMEWADSMVWAAVLDTPGAGDDGFLKGTLLHLHLVQRSFLWMWIEALGGPVALEELQPDADPNVMPARELKSWAKSYYPLVRRWLEEVDPRIDAVIEFANAEALEERLAKPPEPVRVNEALYQVLAHTAHHRGQVNRRLRELGGEPPIIDYVMWVWLGRPEPAW